MNRYSPLEWLKCVNEQSVTFTIAVSSQLRQISVQLANAANETKIRSLRCIVASSEQLETQVKTNLLSRIHCQFHECYGTSEIAIASNLNHALDFKKLDSVGKPAPGVEIKILLKNGKIAEAGETGEIICKTPMIFGGYFNRPDLTKEAMYEDYFRTGDIGRMDDEGYLYFMGRIKDVIITGGINIYPKDIESVLLGHPSILECAVFPIHDDKLGEIVAVAIVSRSPESFDKRKIRFYCAKHLADFQQPRRYFLIDVLPKNSVEKVMKRSLSILFAEKKMREI
jgi:long-chain acyl-CoA synthetase